MTPTSSKKWVWTLNSPSSRKSSDGRTLLPLTSKVLASWQSIFCSLEEVEGGITFYIFEKQYYLAWRNLSSFLGFNTICSIDLNHTLKGFNRHEFWRVLSSQNVVGKF
jgi:hypothetical protein